MHQCNQRKQLVERPKSLLCSIACKPATVCLEQTVRGVIIPTLPFYLKILWFFFNVSASSAAVNLSQMWYPGSPCGSSTKCLGTVTLQSPDAHSGTRGRDASAYDTWDGTRSLSLSFSSAGEICHSWLLCRFALELDEFQKGARKTAPWRADSVNPLTGRTDFARVGGNLLRILGSLCWLTLLE